MNNTHHHSPLRRARRAIAGLAALVLMTSACGSNDDAFAGVQRQQRLDVADIRLPDVTEPQARGQALVSADGTLEMRAAPDRLLLVYFGFTNCPDVCPTTLLDLKAGLRGLDPEIAQRVDVTFVTVDPERDTAGVLNIYMPYFFDRFHVLRPDSEQQLRAAADAFLVSYERSIDDDGDVQVAHSAVLYAVDESGSVAIEWPFGTTAASMGADIERLLQGENS